MVQRLQDTPGFTANPVTEQAGVAPEVQETTSPPVVSAPVSPSPAVTPQANTPGEELTVSSEGIRSAAEEVSTSSVIQDVGEGLTAVLEASQATVEPIDKPIDPMSGFQSTFQYSRFDPVAIDLSGPVQVASTPELGGYRSVFDTDNTPQISQGSLTGASAAASKGGSPLDIAMGFLGHDERDSAQATALSAFFKEAAGVNINPVDTAWCAAFLNSVLGAAGIDGTGSLAARSFLNIGDVVDTPKVGDIVVFSRGDPKGWQGHVGIIADVLPDGRLKVLGGNQSTPESGGRGVSVNIQTYGTDRVLGYRRVHVPS